MALRGQSRAILTNLNLFKSSFNGLQMTKEKVKVKYSHKKDGGPWEVLSQTHEEEYHKNGKKFGIKGLFNYHKNEKGARIFTFDYPETRRRYIEELRIYRQHRQEKRIDWLNEQERRAEESELKARAKESELKARAKESELKARAKESELKARAKESELKARAKEYDFDIASYKVRSTTLIQLIREGWQ
jgi:hypothetical protein